MSKGTIAKMLVAIFVIATFLAVVVATPTVQSAPPEQGGTSPDSLVRSTTTKNQAAADTAVAYWTAERMAAAKPYPMPVLTKQSKPTTASPAVTGPAGLVSGAAPGAKANTNPTYSSPVSLALPMGLTYYSYPPPYNTTGILQAWVPTYPFQTIGKVFFTQNGTNYVCSGTSTTSTTGRLVMTAGHCVADGAGHWSYNVVFCPAWWSGPTKGCWGEIDLWTFYAWLTSGNLRRDVGAIVTADTPYVGGRMQSAIGSQGFAWNWGPQNGGLPQLWFQMGYPQASPFDGTKMWAVESSLAMTDSGIGGAGPDTNGAGNNLTGGSSGGGWIWQFKFGTYGYLNGHNDYKYTSPSWPEMMFSPYYDTTVYNLWNAAQADYP